MSSVKVSFILALALIFKCGFSTSWFSKDVYSAPSPVTPTQNNNLLGIIDQSDIMTFSMDITINSFPDSQWSNIFKFGNNNTYLPGIWLYDATIGFEICISNINTWNDCENVQIPDNNLQTDTKYSLKILYTQSSLVISINDVNYFENSNYPSHTVLNDQAIYAGHPWWPSANVLIENLKIQIPADLCGGYHAKYPEDVEGVLFAYSGSFHGKPYYQNVAGGGVPGEKIYYNKDHNHWRWFTSLDEVDTSLGANWKTPMLISAAICGHCNSNPTQNLTY